MDVIDDCDCEECDPYLDPVPALSYYFTWLLAMNQLGVMTPAEIRERIEGE